MNVEKKSYTVKEAALALTLSVSTIRRWIAKGHLDATRDMLRHNSEWQVDSRSIATMKALLEQNDMLNLKEAIEYTGLSRSTIIRYIDSGDVGAVKARNFIGHAPYAWRIKKDDLDNMLKTRAQQPREKSKTTSIGIERNEALDISRLTMRERTQALILATIIKGVHNDAFESPQKFFYVCSVIDRQPSAIPNVPLHSWKTLQEAYLRNGGENDVASKSDL